MEILAEFLLDLVVEGSLELGTSRRVPMPVRILALLVFTVFWCAVIGVVLLAAVLVMKSFSVLLGLLLVLIDVLAVWKTVVTVGKKLRCRHLSEED